LPAEALAPMVMHELGNIGAKICSVVLNGMTGSRAARALGFRVHAKRLYLVNPYDSKKTHPQCTGAIVACSKAQSL